MGREGGEASPPSYPSPSSLTNSCVCHVLLHQPNAWLWAPPGLQCEKHSSSALRDLARNWGPSDLNGKRVTGPCVVKGHLAQAEGTW